MVRRRSTGDHGIRRMLNPMARISSITVLSWVAALAACGGKGTSTPAPATPTQTATTTPPAADPAEEPEQPPVIDDAPPPPPDEPPPEPVTMTFEPPEPKVELLSRGKGKKVALRYQAKVGDPADCTMIMDLTVAAAQTVTLPTTTMSWSGKVTLAEKRQLETRIVVDQLDVARGTDALGERAGSELRTKLRPMMNATIDAEMTDRGIQLKSSFTSQGALDPQTAMGMQSGAGGGLIVPEQPIGVGGRWKVTRVDHTGLVSTTTVATFEVVSRTGDTTMIRGDVEAVATPSMGPTVTSRGTSEATFTGALCAYSKTSLKTELPPPVAMTMDMVLVTQPRIRP